MRFLRFCRSLALVSGPCALPLVMASVPAFVEGCGDNVGQCNGVSAGSCGAFPAGPYYEAGSDTRVEDTNDSAIADVADAGGGPQTLPDLPFFDA